MKPSDTIGDKQAYLKQKNFPNKPPPYQKISPKTPIHLDSISEISHKIQRQPDLHKGNRNRHYFSYVKIQLKRIVT